MKDVPVGVMGQVQAYQYRHFVHARLVEQDEKDSCCNPTCQPNREHVDWVECENCFSWWHFHCAKLLKKPVDFYCEECQKRIQ